MDKIYGYKQKDIIGLAEFLMQKGEMSLSSMFEKYGAIHGKAKGTVRNLYYALAKKSNEDQDFCKRYLNGTPIKISKGVEFNKEEERELIKNILYSKTTGKSVRAIIMQMSNGNAKTALRYQNKYRNALKNKPKLVADIIKEIQAEGKVVNFSLENKESNIVISNHQFDRLKFEIDGLVQKISSKIKKENEHLKQRIGVLESENRKLISLLYSTENAIDTQKFFKTKPKKQFIN